MVKATTSKPRVFLSSVVNDFTEYREAARRGILAGGGEPILVNEDLSASGESSRNACLDAVESCDLFALIIGDRGGWTAPSGKFVTEEEYCHARAHRLPVLVFLQDVERDADAERFAGAVSEYTRGTLHRKWRTPDELQSLVAQAVRDSLVLMKQPINSPSAVALRLEERTRSDVPLLRFVLVPERQEEVVTPMDLESDDFVEMVQGLGHSRSVRLLSYSMPKVASMNGDALVITQDDPNGRRDRTEFVRLKVSEGGAIEIDIAVTQGEDGSDFSAGSMIVLTRALTAALQRVLAFAASFYDRVDPHRRHQRFMYGVSLLGLGYRAIVRDVKRGQGIPISMRADKALSAFGEARDLTRDDLGAPGREIERTVTLLERASRV